MNFRQSALNWRRIAGIMAVAATAAFGAASTAAQAETVLRMAKTSIPRILDPHFTTSFTERDFGYLIYDTLFAVDHTFTVKPQMVESWTVSDDRLSYTFKLRDGLTFHNGAPVRSADCIASIQRWAQRDGMGQKLAGLTKEWTAVDDRTFKLTLSRPYGFVLETLGKVGASVPFIMPESVAKTPITETIKDYTGSGPFVFDQSAGTSGVKLVFRRFDKYVPRSEPADWATGGKVAKVDKVEWIEFRDPMTAVNALTNREIDFIHELPHDLAPLLESDRKVKVMVYNELGQLGFIRFNSLFPPFNDVNARRAVLLAVNQKDFLQGLVGNEKYYSVCRSIYSCGSPYETDAGVPAVDLAKAKQALKASSYDGSPIVQFAATNSATIGPLSEVLTRVLKDVGFNVKVEAMDFQTFTRKRLSQSPPADGGWNIALSTWTGPDVVDPVVNVSLGGAGLKAQWGWPSLPEIDALRDRFASTADPAERKTIAAEIQKLNYEQAIYIPTGTFKALAAYADNVKGIEPAPALMLWGISKN
ncbi:ABC transporter substrate-binding protein [Rhodopseudomonas palustris]|uniref:ABC transporter substrate-binding protein n=1 Tax=Rhodopseudomonas palustris TaxID=1076 RepID=UPI0011C47A0D|nr:ABC transporter substrate-binding protein [Rhodopseudomonas palustris]